MRIDRIDDWSSLINTCYFDDFYYNFIICILYQGETTKDFSIAVDMMKRIHSLLDKYSELLQEADRKLIARCLTCLGFDELARSLYSTQVTYCKSFIFTQLDFAVHKASFKYSYLFMFITILINPTTKSELLKN